MASNTTQQTNTGSDNTSKPYPGDDKSTNKISPPIQPGTSVSESTTTKISPPIQPE